MNLRRIIQTYLREYYLGKLEEVKQNRMYLIAQSRDTHRMLDEEVTPGW